MADREPRLELQVLLFAEHIGGLEDNRAAVVGVVTVMGVDRGARATWPINVYTQIWAPLGHYTLEFVWKHHGRTLFSRTVESEHAPALPRPIELVLPLPNGLAIEGIGDYVMELYVGDAMLGRALMKVGYRELVAEPPSSLLRPNPLLQMFVLAAAVSEAEGTDIKRVLSSLRYPPGTTALPPMAAYFLIWDLPPGPCAVKLEWVVRGRVLRRFETEGIIEGSLPVASTVPIERLELDGSGIYSMHLFMNGLHMGEARLDIDLSDPTVAPPPSPAQADRPPGMSPA